MTKFLEHKDIYLRPQQEEDAAFFYTWNNDALTRGKIGEKRSKSLLQIQQSLNKQRSDSIWFSVVKKDSDEVIGETGFLRMDPDNGCSDFSIILPYAAQQHKGYGKQVVKLMFAYAFGYLHLHRLAIGVVDFNTEALQFYKRVGFQQEGIYEESYYYDFKYHDFIMMRILKQEYLRLYQAECKSRT